MPVLATENRKRLLELKREKLRRNHPRLYLAKYHHLNVHGKRMEFGDKYRFLIPLYKGILEREVYEKSVQCYVSEMLIVTALEIAEEGLRVLYVMPNIDFRGKFVKDRLDRLLKIVPYYNNCLREAIGSADGIGMKHFGRGLLNFVGSNSPAEFTSYPADALIVDEVDKCDQKNLEMAPDRLDASDYKYDVRCGNPSIEDWGIDASFKLSTQSLWKMKCGHCNKRQTPDFFKNVVNQVGELRFELKKGDKGNPFFVCKKCGSEMDRLGEGQWINQFEKDIRGRRISQLFSSNVTLSSLVDKFFKSIGNEIKTQLFYNSKLGLPYASSGSKVIMEILEKAAERGENYALGINNTILAGKERRMYVGIDVGKYYYVIGRARLSNGQRKLVYIGRHLDTKSLVSDLNQLKAKVITIDEFPETREVETLKKYFRKMFSCIYKRGDTFLDLRKKSLNYKKEKRVSIDRTFILDSVKKDFEIEKMINPNNARDIGNEEMEEYGEYYQQMMSSTRTFVEEKGRFEWREATADHFFHAEAYCKFAEELDDRILDYYEDKTEGFKFENLEETKARTEKEKEIIPKKKEDLELIKAEEFLRRLRSGTEGMLGKQEKSFGKTRAEMDNE